MKLKSLLLFFPLTLTMAAVHADEVNESDITSFTDGTSAVAGEVNNNFQALIAAINDNAAGIKLNNENMALLLSSDSSVAGSTYKQVYQEVAQAVNDNGIQTNAFTHLRTSTLSFNEDGTTGEWITDSCDTYIASDQDNVHELRDLGCSDINQVFEYTQDGNAVEITLTNVESALANVAVSLLLSTNGDSFISSFSNIGPAGPFTRAEAEFSFGIRIE